MASFSLLDLAEDLELVGLVWHPEIGDEVSRNKERDTVSVLVDTCGLTPRELRGIYLWLPTVEQMVSQLEARQAVLCHTGLELTTSDLFYKTIVKSPSGEFESKARSLRLSVGFVLRDLLASNGPDSRVH